MKMLVVSNEVFDKCFEFVDQDESNSIDRAEMFHFFQRINAELKFVQAGLNIFLR